MRSNNLYKINYRGQSSETVLGHRYNDRVVYLENNRIYMTTYKDEKEVRWEYPCQGCTALYFNLEKVTL
jgi:hypothetical protein